MANKLSRRDFLRLAASSSAAAGIAFVGVQPIAAQGDGVEFSLAMVTGAIRCRPPLKR